MHGDHDTIAIAMQAGSQRHEHRPSTQEHPMSNQSDFPNELAGRRALVTGGTRGIGAAVAQRLLDAGAKVVVAARKPDADMPAGATFVSGDVATSEGVDAIATQALAALGGLDILVNKRAVRARFWKGRRRFPTRHGTTASSSTFSPRSASPTPSSPRSGPRRLQPS